MWKVRETKTVELSNFASMIIEEVELPTGEVITWHRNASNNDAVAVLARNEQGQFLLTREYTYPLQDFVIDLPGGGVEEDENIKLAANRELQEEGGFSAATLEPLGSYMGDRRRSTSRMHVFLGTNLTESSLPQDTGEQIEVFWASAAEIQTMIEKGQIVSPRVLITWLFYGLKFPA